MIKKIAKLEIVFGALLTFFMGCEKDLLDEYSSASQKITFKKPYVVESDQGKATIPPGTKDADKVELKPGSLVVDPATANELSVDLNQVSFQEPIHISGPETVPQDKILATQLAIYLKEGQTSLSETPYRIAYDVLAGGARRVGITSNITMEANALTMIVVGFGNYQIIRFQPGAEPPPDQEVAREGQPLSKEEADKLPILEVKLLRPLIVYQDGEVIIEGNHFREGVSFAFQNKSYRPTLLSQNEARLKMADARIGFAPLYITQAGVTKQLTLGFAGSEGDYPLTTMGAEKICQGEKFYNPDGELLEGAKTCSDVSGLDPKIILEGHQVGGVGGVAGALPVCRGEGQSECVARGDFKVADTRELAGKVVSGQTVAGVSGNVTLPQVSQVAVGVQYGVGGVQLTGSAGVGAYSVCASDGDTGCVASSGFAAALLSGLADKVISGQTVAGVGGNVTLPLVGDVESGVNFGADGNEFTGTFAVPGSGKVESNVTYGGGGTEFSGTLVVPAESNVADGVTFGSAGTEFTGSATLAPGNCSSDGSTNCVATGTYAAVLTTGLADKVLSGQTVAGVGGNVTLPDASMVLDSTTYGISGSSMTGSIADCSSNGEDGCYLDSGASFDAADLSNLSAGNIKSGVTIAGQAGDYPSSTYPLASNTGATDLTSLGSGTTPGSYEFFDSAGSVYSTTVAAGGTINPTTSQQDFSGASTVYNGFSVAGDADLVASNIKSSVDIFGVTGSVTEAPAACSADGETTCVANATYAAAFTTGAADKILSGQSLAGVSGNITLPLVGSVLDSVTYGVGGTGSTGTIADCSSNGEDSCYLDSGTSFDAADLTNLSAGNIKSGVTIAGQAGDYPSSTYPLASNTGATDLTSLGSGTTPGSYEFFDSAGSVYSTIVAAGGIITPTTSQQDFSGASTVYNGFSVAGDTDLVGSNIKSSIDLFGVTGYVTEAPTACSTDGETTCVANATYAAAFTTGAADKILSGQSLAGVSGNITLPLVGSVLDSVTYGVGGTGSTGTIADCSSNGEDSCYLDSGTSFDAADLTNLSAGNIKSGVTIAGQAGDYPSSTYPLPSASATADLDSATFNAKVKSGSAFEYWTSDGSYQTGAGDADIAAGNILSGVSIFGTSGNVPVPQCTAGTQGPCESDSACRWTGSACELDPWHIRSGITIGGQAGSIKANCRNRANGSIYNSDSMPPGTSAATAGSNIDWWDTIDNWNDNGNNLPTEQPSGWTSDHMCGKELWSDETADGACDSAGDDCMMRDEVTGLLWSEGYPVTGVASADSTKDWSDAVSHCNSLDYGGSTYWRLPTQMELQTASMHGIRELGYKGGGTIRPSGDTLDNNDLFIANIDAYFWSASTSSFGSTDAWTTYLADGFTGIYYKTASYRVLCVAP